jgi:glutathione peroxidase
MLYLIKCRRCFTMKNIKLFLFLIIFLLTSLKLMANEDASVFDFEFIDIDGNTVKLSKFIEKPLLILNTASRCGFTPQYEGLQNLFTIYRKSDLTIIAMTSNSFKQEYSNTEDIKKICLVSYNAGFIISSPIEVKGDLSHPLFKWLKNEYGKSPKWNFYKYLFDRSGKLVKSWSSMTKPDSKKIIKEIDSLI